MIGLQSPPLSQPKRVVDVIMRAFRIAKITGAGETPRYSELSDALDTMNGIIDEVNLSKTLAPYEALIAIPLQAQKPYYSVGPSSASPPPDIISARPVELLSAICRRGGVDFPVAVTNQLQDYNRIRLKGQEIIGWTSLLYYQASYPSGLILVYPIPGDTDSTLFITASAQIGIYDWLNTEVELPPLYRTWLEYKLAERVCPEYGLDWSEASAKVLNDIDGTLRANNVKPYPVSTVGLDGLSDASGYNGYYINTDSVVR